MGRMSFYDYDKMVQAFVDQEEMTYEEATEWVDFNIVGAYVGENTPLVFYPPVEY
jgi:hypothetical protein